LETVALDYFRRVGHDNHRRLSKLFAWEEKKSKTSWGAETVDYEKIAAAAVQANRPRKYPQRGQPATSRGKPQYPKTQRPHISMVASRFLF